MIAKTDDPPIFECPKCSTPLEITFQGLESQPGKIIRKGQCPNITCGGRIWSWAKQAKAVDQPKNGVFTCKVCKEQTEVLHISSKGLCCKECFHNQIGGHKDASIY